MSSIKCIKITPMRYWLHRGGSYYKEFITSLKFSMLAVVFGLNVKCSKSFCLMLRFVVASVSLKASWRCQMVPES